MDSIDYRLEMIVKALAPGQELTLREAIDQMAEAYQHALAAQRLQAEENAAQA